MANSHRRTYYDENDIEYESSDSDVSNDTSYNILDEIDVIEMEFRDGEKLNNSYYLGFTYCNEIPKHELLLSIAVSVFTFFRYNYT